MRLAGTFTAVLALSAVFASCAASPAPTRTARAEGPESAAASEKEGRPAKSASGESPSGSANSEPGVQDSDSDGSESGAATKKSSAAAEKKSSDDEASGGEGQDDPCPPEMVYVEGEYCTASSNDAKPDKYGNTPGGGAADIKAIERECLREWYAPQNKKKVCELFSKEARCKGKMIKKRFCIDRYAWPNVKGHKPEVMNRFHQAQIKCAAAGKRLCTESEWTMSCEGPDMQPFPYGVERDTDKCHGDEPWDNPDMKKVAARDKEELRRLYKGKPSGQEECKSEYGVYDLPGNTDEIVASETFESGWRGKFDSVHTGGPWYKGVRNQCRPKIYTHNEGFYYYFLSFRCCADAGAETVDPRTPKQKRKGWDMARVERIAGITVEEMRELLEKKKTDPTCGCKTTRCRTFCGTLHGDPGTGPDAWNPPLGEKAGNGMPPLEQKATEE